MKQDTQQPNQLGALVYEADERHAARELAEACRLAGVGVSTVQSRDRRADTARRRAVVAWLLCDWLGWRQAKAARALNVTVRHVKRMVVFR